MHILTLPLGAYQTNCYLVWSDESAHCLVIDPGYYPDEILSAAEKAGKTIAAIFLTHGHFDHTGAVEELVQKTGCQLWMHQSDYSPARHPLRKQLYPLSDCAFPPVNFYEEGEVVTIAGCEFQILETPGHSQGSVCILSGRNLFTGDTLFRGSCGRTDLLGGSWHTIQDSLQRLKNLEGNYTIYPGHGPSSTLEEERAGNPYLL